MAPAEADGAEAATTPNPHRNRAAAAAATACLLVAAVVAGSRPPRDGGRVSLDIYSVSGLDKQIHAAERGEADRMHARLEKEREEGMRALRREGRRQEQQARLKGDSSLDKYVQIGRFGDESGGLSSRAPHHGEGGGGAAPVGGTDGLAAQAADGLKRVLRADGNATPQQHRLAEELRNDIAGLKGLAGAGGATGSGTARQAGSSAEGRAGGGQEPSMASMERKLREWELKKARGGQQPQQVALQRKMQLANAAPAAPAPPPESPQERRAVAALRNQIQTPAELYRKEFLTEKSAAAPSAGRLGCVELSQAYRGHPVMLEAACTKNPSCKYDFGKQDCGVRE